MGHRLAGTATVNPAKAAPKTAPKLEVSPPRIVADGKIVLKLTGTVPESSHLTIQVHPAKGNQGHGPPVVMPGVVTFDAATKAYSVAADADSIKKVLGDDKTKARVVQVSLVLTLKDGGKLQTITAENRAVVYREAPKIAVVVTPKGVETTVQMTTPTHTDIAFPAFDQKVGVQVLDSGDPNVESVSLKTPTWRKTSGVFTLKSGLDIKLKDSAKPLEGKFKVQLRIIDDALRAALPLDKPGPQSTKAAKK